MWPESEEQNRPLRSGLTTGSCATACSVAAIRHLLLGTQLNAVSITLPKGQVVELAIEECSVDSDIQQAYACTIKDAGDDPDVTHGALIQVWVKLDPNAAPGNVTFCAGPGVGSVTRQGLLLEVGEPAINPVPRKMMIEHIQTIAQQSAYQGGFIVTVGIKNGDTIATKTMNPRLGILGGLSILGTTGIVRPFSCAAYIASIHQGIDVARANGFAHIAATTGSTSEDYIRQQYQMPDMTLIEMGDFVGAVLKHLRHNPVERLSLCGGFGKISKLASGHMDLHSSASSIDLVALSQMAASLGASEALVEQIVSANTSIEALSLCQAQGIDLASAVCNKARDFAQAKAGGDVAVDVWAVDRKGKLVGRSISDCNNALQDPRVRH